MIVRIRYFHTPIKSKSWAVRRANMVWAKVQTSGNFAFTHGGIGSLDISISPIGYGVTDAILDLPAIQSEVELLLFLNYMNQKDFHSTVVQDLTPTPQSV